MKKTALRWSAIGFAVAIVIGEWFARYYLGLGTPPLSVSHRTVEYLYRANQDAYRFGNHFFVNSYGMRSEPFSLRKPPGELRLMVYGDSVVNGGSATDQRDLATTILGQRLASERHRNVTVGNVSAGSWGPGNWLAYAEEYGFFDADVVVLVISSHDYTDNPTFDPLDPDTHPTETPFSALTEGLARYLPRYLANADHPGTQETARSAAAREQQAQRGLNDLRGFLELASARARTVMVFQHLEKSEIDKHATDAGYARIRKICEAVGIVPISLEPYFRRSLENGVNPYRDNIHPNKHGQMLIAEAIMAGCGSHRSACR